MNKFVQFVKNIFCSLKSETCLKYCIWISQKERYFCADVDLVKYGTWICRDL